MQINFYSTFDAEMKPNKSIFLPLFLLACFLGSFFTSIYLNTHLASTNSNLKNQTALVFSAKKQSAATLKDLIIEKNESESKKAFQAQVFVLPNLFSFFQCKFVQIDLISQVLAVKLITPIYISYCNLRI